MAMQTLFMDGFDHYTDLLQKWDNRSLSTVVITSEQARNGGQSVKFPGSYNLSKALGMNARTLVIGFAIYVTGFPSANQTILGIAAETATQLVACINASGLIELRLNGANGALLAISGSALSSGRWYYVELRCYIDNTAGELELRINGLTTATFVGDTQYLSSTNYATSFFINGALNATYFDDLYVRGDTVNTAGGFFGDCKVVTRYPQADGAYAQMTPLTGPGHYPEVDEALGDADTSYVYSATSGHRDSYDMQAVGEVGEVRAVQAVAMLRKTDAGYRVVRNLIKSGATVAVSGDKGLGTNYRAVPQVYDTDPATGAAWTVAGLDAAEFGVEIG